MQDKTDPQALPDRTGPPPRPGKPAAEAIKIFGERNTATNAVTLIIRKNSRTPLIATTANMVFARTAAPGAKLELPKARIKREARLDQVFAGAGPIFAWKHAATHFSDISDYRNCLVLFCVRHPASWLMGLHRRPYNNLVRLPADFRAFLDLEWVTLGRELLDGARLDPITLYNEKLRSYLHFINQLQAQDTPYHIVRQEDFAMDQTAFLSEIRPYLSKPKRRFKPIQRSTKDKTKDAEYYRNYYTKELWRAEIDAECMAEIEARVDWQAAGVFGYHKGVTSG
ncbi:MAG: hypothetical protein LJE68_17800 [Rhodobacter sp.]|nr:hypothetical protein [Rhodobacter sp.]